MSEKPEIEEGLYDLTLVGISPGWLPAFVDDEWVAIASQELRNVGPKEYLKTMIRVLRAKLGGREKRNLPNKHDICSCGSGKKFGKCCSGAFEAGDVKACLAHGHDWSDWNKIEQSGRYFRNCRRCNGLEGAHDGCELEWKGGIKILSIGCDTCNTVVVDLDAIALAVHKHHEKHCCAACGKPFNTRKPVLGHEKTPTGCVLKVLSEDLAIDDYCDLNSSGWLDGEGVAIHEVCFRKALPFWSRVCSLPKDREVSWVDKPPV